MNRKAERNEDVLRRKDGPTDTQTSRPNERKRKETKKQAKRIMKESSRDTKWERQSGSAKRKRKPN